MFTGIVEQACPVVAAEERDGLRRLVLDLEGLERAPDGSLTGLGDSIAVNGVCLTVAALDGDRAAFDAIPETLGRTNLGGLVPGSRVNVERALRFGDRVDGHLVQGHVETTGEVTAVEALPGETRLSVACGPAFAAQCLHKGSVTVDGVSLTVAALDAEAFTVALVPHTLERTTLSDRRVGERVNLEPDMIGQWVLRAVATGGIPGPLG